MMCKDLEKLKNITNSLSEIPMLSDFKHYGGNLTQYKFKKGNVISLSLYDDEIKIQKSFMAKNNCFDTHKHIASKEIFIILEGKLELYMNGVTKILNRYDNLVINKNIPHSGKALTDLWVITLIIPNEDGCSD